MAKAVVRSGGSAGANAKPWVPEIERARELVSQGESKRKVAKYLGMPESTLRKRLKNLSRASIGTGVNLGQHTPTTTFTAELEEELVKYCNAFNDMSGGLTFTALRKIAYNFAEENHIENTFDRSVRMADVEFVNDFVQRHPPILRALRSHGADVSHHPHAQAQQTQHQPPSQHQQDGKEQLVHFFDRLKEQLLTHQFNASRIYNVALLDVSVARPDKTTDAISAICCMSAAAHYVPPAFVFHAHVFSLELLNGAPPCSIAIPHNLDIFLEWLRHFQKHVRSSHQDPVLLVTNDHTFSSSKCVSEFCRFHGIVLLDLPSIRLQPLHKTVFGSFRVLYGLECEAWGRLHRAPQPHQPPPQMTHRHVAAVFRKAYFRAATMENAVEGFRMTGICPYDRDVASDTVTTDHTTALCHTIFQNVVCEYDELDVKPASTAAAVVAAAAYAAAVDQVANGVCDLAAAGFPDMSAPPPPQQQQHGPPPQQQQHGPPPQQQQQQHGPPPQQQPPPQCHGPRIESAH